MDNKLKTFGLDDSLINSIFEYEKVNELSFSFENMVKNYYYFLSCNLSDSAVKRMFRINVKLCFMNCDDIKKVYDYLLLQKYSKGEIKHIIFMEPNIFDYSELKLDKFRKVLKSFGFSNDEINKMSSVYPEIIMMDIKDFKKKLDFLLNLGFSLSIARSITLNNPKIFCRIIYDLKERYNLMLKFGYDKEDLNKMITLYPFLFTIKGSYIDRTRKTFKSYSFDDNQINLITACLPNIYGFKNKEFISRFNLFKKYSFDDETLKKLILKNSELLGVSLEELDFRLYLMKTYYLTYIPNEEGASNVVYARGKYLTDNGYMFEKDASKVLIVSHVIFEKIFGVKDEDLLLLYPRDIFTSEKEK